MFRNFLKMAWRNIFRNKVYATITISLALQWASQHFYYCLNISASKKASMVFIQIYPACTGLSMKMYLWKNLATGRNLGGHCRPNSVFLRSRTTAVLKMVWHRAL